MSPSKVEPCPHCGSVCLTFVERTMTPEGDMYVRCMGDSCGARGPRARWTTTVEEELIRRHNAFARRASAGRMLAEAAAEVNAERFVSLRGKIA